MADEIWSERPPVQLPINTPASLTNLLPMLAMASKAAQGGDMAPGGAGPGVVSPERVGGAPPNVVTTPGTTSSALPAQAAAMSPMQVGGPAARGANVRGYEGPMQFRSPQARTGAVVDSAIKSMYSAMQNFKQQRFEQEAAQAQVIALAQIAEQKRAAGQPLTQQDINAIQGAAKLDKKRAKLIEKSLTDPMSGAYVGTQRAYQSYQMQEAQKAEMDKVAAEAEYHRAMAAKAAAEARFTDAYKGQLKEQELKDRQTAAQNRLIAQEGKQGYNVEFDENGKMTRRSFTPEEIAADPDRARLAALDKAKIDRMVAMTKQGAYRLALEEKKLQFQKEKLGVMTQLKLKDLEQKGAKMQQLTGKDKQRVSQVYMASGYLDKMVAIAQKHPDWFGPGGWGENNLKRAFGNQEPEAVEFMADAELLSLPLIGIHGSNGVRLAREIKDFSSGFYQSPQATLAKLNEMKSGVDKAETDILRTYAIQPPKPGDQAPPAGSASKSTQSGDKPPGW